MYRAIPLVFLLACTSSLNRELPPVDRPADDAEEPSAFDEKDEVDDDLPDGVVTPLPDLAVVSMNAQSDDTGMWFELEIANLGAADAPATELGLFLDQTTAPQPGDVAYSQHSVPAIPAGSSYAMVVQADSAAFAACADGCQSWLLLDSASATSEADEDNNAAGPIAVTTDSPGPTTVGANLKVTDLTWTEANGTVSYIVTVRNDGDENASGTFAIDLFADSASAPALTSIGDADGVLYGLWAGTETTLQITHDVDCTAGCTAWATVDSYGYIPETDETDNRFGPVTVTTSSTPPPPTTNGPDLQVTSVTWTENAGVVDYSITVKNHGDEEAVDFDIDVYGDQANAPTTGDIGNEWWMVAHLAAGDETTLPFSITQDCSTGCTSWVQVDSMDSVLETDETDNVYGPMAVGTVQTPPPTTTGPDLQVVSATWAETPSGIDYTVIVRNDGDEEAIGFDVDIYGDQAIAPAALEFGDDWNYVASLAAGDEKTLALSITKDCSTGCTSWVQVDSSGDVTESDETDNVHGPIAVNTTPTQTGDANLVITSFSWTEVGTGFDYEITVRNTGNADATTPIIVDVYGDWASAPVLHDIGDEWGQIDFLNAGEEQTVTLSLTQDCSAGCTSWAQVDTEGGVTESDETDNVHGGIAVTSTPSTTPGIDLVVGDATWQKNGSDFDFTVTVRNDGTVDSTGFYVDLFADSDTQPSGTSDDFEWIGSLQAGAETTVTMSHTADCSTGCTSWVYVDPNGGISETAEDNNFSEHAIGFEIVGTLKQTFEFADSSYNCESDLEWVFQDALAIRGLPPTEVDISLVVDENRISHTCTFPEATAWFANDADTLWVGVDFDAEQVWEYSDQLGAWDTFDGSMTNNTMQAAHDELYEDMTVDGKVMDVDFSVTWDIVWQARQN
jgi:uncharacterized repeat protein (TIGR01451 family)